nr:unnamed protein product [Spirometra erinaceieuropaei]
MALYTGFTIEIVWAALIRHVKEARREEPRCDRPQHASSSAEQWGRELQVSIQKINGVYPKGLEDEGTDPRKQISNTIFFHEAKGRLFITFNQKLTLMEMKPEQTRVFSHDTPVVGAIYNAAFNQVVTVSQCGTISYWLVETGQRVKKAVDCHNGAEVTCLTQEPSGSNFYTGATDGTVKVWDMNAHCHHTLICFTNAVTDISHIVVLRRAVIVMGNSKHFTAFKMTNFDEHYVFPSEWKGAPVSSNYLLVMVPRQFKGN